MRPLLVLLWIGVVAIFSGALAHDFVNYDDFDLIVGNPVVRGGLTRESIWWALTTSHHASFMPLTWLSHLVDVELFGLDPAGHHATSILLHATNAVLVAVVFARYGGDARLGVLVAALFALHPLRVESVAWVAERKDVLSGLLFLLLLLAHRRHAGAPSGARLLISTLLLGAGLLAKPMLVTAPCVLLLLDGWPLRRIHDRQSLTRSVVEKLPMMALVGASIAWTLGAQTAAMSTLEALPLTDRLENAVVAVVRYLGMTLWPLDLACLYPWPRGGWPMWQVGGAVVVLVAATVAATRWWRRAPGVLVGWLWFLGMLVPVIGIVQVGRQAIADRYTYLPSLGLLVAGASAVASAPSRVQRWLVAVAVVVATAWAGLTLRQVPVWQDTVVLFGHALEVTADNDLAHAALANTLMARGDVGDALPHLEAAARLTPNAQNLDRLARAHLRREDGIRAEPLLRQAVALEPGIAAHQTDLGRALLLLGRIDEALAVHAEALRLAPDDARAWHWQGVALAAGGRLPEALAALDRAANLEPGALTHPLAQATILLDAGRLEDALPRLRALQRTSPHAIEVLVALSRATRQAGQFDEAVAIARDAVARSEARHVDALIVLAEALEAGGDAVEAARVRTTAMERRRQEGLSPRESAASPVSRPEPPR